MPELPDVELYKRYFNRCCRGKVISAAAVKDRSLLGKVSGQALARHLKGARIAGSRRYGKYLLADLGKSGWLALHFGMNGALKAFAARAEEPPYDRLRLDFRDGSHLAYLNPRRIGRIDWVGDPADLIAREKLGPDALARGFTLKSLAAALAARRADLKSVLMDQSAVAGIGNIYSDEILFQARLHPKTKSNALDAAAVKRLYHAIRTVLKTAIVHGAGAEQSAEHLPQNFLIPHRHRDGHCPRCGLPLVTIKQGARTGYYCSHCQQMPH